MYLESDSAILELQPVQIEITPCRVSQSIPSVLAFLCITVPGIQCTANGRQKPAGDTLSTKPANILPQTPFHLVLHNKKQAPAVSSVRYLQPLTEE